MQPYMVFWGYIYYPGGGWEDDHKGFDSQGEAEAFALGCVQESFTWSHVVEVATDKIVCSYTYKDVR